MNSVQGLEQDFYCTGVDFRPMTSFYCGNKICGPCENRHRKWPTPEQFRKEYGREWGDFDSVYVLVTDADEDGEKKPELDRTDWISYPYHGAKEWGFKTLVCACTPWGKPPKDWRPE